MGTTTISRLRISRLRRHVRRLRRRVSRLRRRVSPLRMSRLRRRMSRLLRRMSRLLSPDIGRAPLRRPWDSGETPDVRPSQKYPKALTTSELAT